MIKILKFIGFISATLALFFIVAALAFYNLVRVGDFRRFLADQIEKQTDLKVQLGAADFEIGWITGVVFQNVALTDGDDARPALTAERVTARVALRPLLQRQVIFYEIRLTRPVAHLVRDSEGRVALLDKLANLPFLKQHQGEFSLDLRSVRVDGADIELVDHASAGEPRWRLVKGSLEIDRMRGQRLREFFQRGAAKRDQQPAPVLGAEFDLNGIVVKNGARMNLKARGDVVFPQANLDLRQAHWNADVDMVDFPAALLKDAIGPDLPIKALSGHLAERVHVDGNSTQQLRLRGEVEFKQVSIDAPELFLAALDRTDGHASFDFEWRPGVWQLPRLDFRANDLHFSMQGEVDASRGKDGRVRLNLSALSAPVSVLRKYLPLKLIAPPRVFDALENGQVDIKKASVDATVAELRELAQGKVAKGISFDVELRDVAGKLPIDAGLPMRAAAARLYLANRVITFQNLTGSFGDTRLISADGNYDLSSENWGKMNAHARADVNLAEIKDQLKLRGMIPQLNKFLASVEELSGRSRIDLTLKRSKDEPLAFDGTMALDRVRARYDEYALNELQGDVSFSPNEIRAQRLRAQLNGAPIQLQIALKDYAGDNGTFDLGVESSGIRAGVLTRLLLDSGSPRDSGTVSGTVRYSGSLASGAKRTFTGNLDLRNVQMMVQPLLQPIRALNGRVRIDETGIDFQNLNASLVGFPVVASGRWRYREKPQLLFDFAAPDLDVSYLISQIDAESSEFYANLVASGKISLTKGRIKNFEFSDLKTDTTIDHRVWHLTNLTANSAGGTIQGVTTIADKPDTLAVLADPKIQGVPIQSFLNWFDLNSAEMTGKVKFSGKLETVGNNDTERKQNLNGAFALRIEDGTIHRMRILVQLLNLLDLSRWFSFQLPDLAKQGIRFRAITGDFKVTHGVYSTDNLVVDSSDLRMTGAGKIDVPKDQLDFVVAVRPFAGIDTAMSYIPLLGRSIAAIKNSFLVASFNITGHIDDPTITPAPLGTLSEWFWGVLGIPKSIIGFGDGETKEKPKAPSEAPIQ